MTTKAKASRSVGNGIYWIAAGLLFLLIRKSRQRGQESINVGDSMANIDTINNVLKSNGIASKAARIGILATIGKESNFIPKSEKCYNTTANDRIRSIFSETRNMGDIQLNILKADCKAFFNLVYADAPGNTQPGDGYKYRGRGLNQITGRSSYQKIGDAIGVDLVNNPDALNDLTIATKAMLQFLMNRANDNRAVAMLRANGYNSINAISSNSFATRFFTWLNAGLGYSITGSHVQQGVNKASKYLPVLQSMNL